MIDVLAFASQKHSAIYPVYLDNSEKLKVYMRIIRFVLVCLSILAIQAKGYSQPGGAPGTEYEIGNVKVIGAEHSDENSIIAVSGFRVGDKVRIPGNDIQRAIKSLWELQLFDDVRIQEGKTIGDVIILEIVVSEKARLTRYDFIGFKKGHLDDLKGKAGQHLLKGGIVTESAKQNVKNGIEGYYIEKGYLDAKAEIKELPDENLENGTKLEIRLNKGRRIKNRLIILGKNL